MNYLAHLLLADDNPQHQLGALMGDFVRGRPETLAQQYPAILVDGIMGHRQVDVFTDAHPTFLQSRSRFSAERRRVAGIIVDMVFDHFLSKHWQLFSNEPRTAFIERVYDVLTHQTEMMPPRMKLVTPKMVEHDWLGSYLELDNIGHALDRISNRFTRKNPLSGAIDEVRLQYSQLEGDFLTFFPDLQESGVARQRYRAGNPS